MTKVSRKIIVGTNNAPEDQRTFRRTTVVFILGIFYTLRRDFNGTRIFHEPRYRSDRRYAAVVGERPKHSSEVIEMRLKISTAIGPEFI